MDDQEDGLMNIYVSDEEDPVAEKAQRNQQAEEDFQAVKETYRARVENGDIYKTVKLPLRAPVNKLYVQELLHAVEELYFFRRWREATEFLTEVLDGESAKALDDDTLVLLRKYETKCKQRLEKSGV